MKGSEFVAQVKDVRNPVLSSLALAEMLKGNMPSWNFSQRMKCSTSAVIDGLYYQCDYFTPPQYLSVGDDADFIQWPLLEPDLQKFCDAHLLTASDGTTSPKFYIPPKKIIFNTWSQSACKIDPQTTDGWRTGTMTWPSEFAKEQALINAAMVKKGCPITAFSRAKKAYITAPNVTGQKLHFTGWYYPDGKCIQCGDATGDHDAGGPSGHADYSHGCDLVYQDVLVNGQQYDFADLCNHSKLWVLVSDQGPFIPRFPNAGVTRPTTSIAPPAVAAPSDFKGDVYKTNASGAPVLVKASSLPASAGGAVVAASGGSLLNVAIGIAAGVGGWMLIKRWRHAH